MDNRIKFGALVAVAFLALGASALVLYSYVTDDWRLTEGLAGFSFFDSDEEEPDDRIASRRLEFDLAEGGEVGITSRGAVVQVVRSTDPVTVVEVWLEGEATDSSLYTVTTELEHPSRLAIRAEGRSTYVPLPNAVKIIVHVPGTNDVSINALGGGVEIEGVAGTINAMVDGGDLLLLGIEGNVGLKTIGGDITIERGVISGNIHAEQGGLQLRYTQGNLKTTATSSISAHQHNGPLTALCSDGPISVELLGSDITSRLVTHRGNVSLGILPTAAATFDVETTEGIVYSNLQLDSTADLVALPNALRATLNGGGSQVMIRAAKGSAAVHLYGEPIMQMAGDTLR